MISDYFELCSLWQKIQHLFIVYLRFTKKTQIKSEVFSKTVVEYCKTDVLFTSTFSVLNLLVGRKILHSQCFSNKKLNFESTNKELPLHFSSPLCDEYRVKPCVKDSHFFKWPISHRKSKNSSLIFAWMQKKTLFLHSIQCLLRNKDQLRHWSTGISRTP